MKHTVKEIRLKNGAKGLLVDIPGSTVMSYQFHFRAGNRFVRKKESYETAHIMEHMAFGANAKFKDEHAYEAEFTKNGAYHNAFTSDLSMVYVADCAEFEWERILELQKFAITEPRFNNEELEAEKGNVKSELTEYLNNQGRVLWPKMQQLLGEDVLTYWQRLQTIQNVTLADIKEHHKRTHTAENLRFVIAGKLHGKKAGILRQLETWKLPKGERFVVPKDELTKANPTLIRRKEVPNLTFGLSIILPRKLNDKERDAMNFLNHILTGTMYSRIYGAARKKGLAYGVYSGTNSYAHDSAWDFEGQVNLDKAPALFDIITREMKSVLNGKISDKELETAKQYALGRHQMGAQTVAQISNFYAGRYFFDGFVKNYEKVPELITGVSKEQIIETACSFLQADTWVLAGVGSAEKELVDKLGKKVDKLFSMSIKE